MKKTAMLYDFINDKTVQCKLCNHRCKISKSQIGFCRVRKNIDGTLYTFAYGKTIAHHIDPIEKKPLYHFLPGTYTYSIATPGCNFHCEFCQNWQISQLKYNDKMHYQGTPMTPDDIVENTQAADCKSISYTYTEPTIFFEYAYETAKKATKKGLSNVFVTNGYMTKEAIETISPYLNAANIDLKSIKNEFYQSICKAQLPPVLETIRYMKELNIWIELTTLLIPGKNDTNQELSNIASFIAQTGKDIPWHISRFYPDYQFTSYKPTPFKTLEKARDIGIEYGIKHIHFGNI